MRRKIPSTAALIAFEAAARHQSFTRAAEELALTQGAVCRQIAALEDFLGVELFRRVRRGVVLSEAGQSYARKVAEGLDAVERDTLAVMGRQGSQSIELAVVPTFGTQWLLPRLCEFQQLQPQISVHLTNRTRPFLFADTPFDAAIYYGDGDWPGARSDALMAENLLPVCSPQWLADGQALDAARLAELPLLQQTTRPYAWRRWFSAQGVSTPRDLSGPRYELFSMLAQAATLSMGVALIPPFLIQRELAEGRLCIAHPAPVPSTLAYQLVIPERRTAGGALGVFREWLLEQAARYRDEESAASRP